MQDSLEDFIKLSKNSRQDDPIKLSKEAQVTAQVKKECDMRAMKIVEFSIEGKLRPEIFIKCLPFINQSHYQDIVEERAIAKLCGYSICGKKIPDMPKKQYYISTKDNKVYDITDRKNYCSNFCYKASLHIKKQIDNSPLWLRKLNEQDSYSFLRTSEGGLPGEYIDQGLVKPAEEPKFASVSIFATASLQDMAEREINSKINKNEGTTFKKCYKTLKTKMQTISENSEQAEEDVNEQEEIKCENNKIKHKRSECNKHMLFIKKLPVIDENEEKIESRTEVEDDPKKVQTMNTKTHSKKPKKKDKSQKVDIEILIKKSLNEWLTLDTFIFLYGENKVKEILHEKKLSDYFESLHVTELEKGQQMRYMDICRRLQLQELADEKFDNALIGNKNLLPIPDYKKLKEENKDLDLKVKSFYGGVLFEKEDPNFPVKKNESDENAQLEPPVIPLVDVNSQIALRRKIFLNSINKAMQQLLQSLRIVSFTAVLSDLQGLVKTFKLKADNIVFKPFVWNYISIILLHMLSIRDKSLTAILEEKSSLTYINLICNTLPNKNAIITDAMSIIQNMELFVENYVTTCEM